MPKMKTHSGTKKRFKRTGSGKIMREAVDQVMSPADVKTVKRLLGMR